MPQFKLKSVKELFPDANKKLLEDDKKLEFGKMFQISTDEKKRVIKTLDEMVDQAKRQREAMMAIKSEAVRNYEGIEKITGPWEGSSNISTMITTIASDMMHAKLFPMVWNLDMLHFEGTEKHDEEIADNNEIMIKWALTKDMENTQEKVDDILHRFVVDGTIAVKVVWEVYYTYVTRVVPQSVDAKGNVKFKVVYDRIRRERARWIIKDIDYVYPTFNADNEQRADIIEEVYLTLPMLREMKERKMILPDIDLDKVQEAVEKTFDPEGTVKARYQAAGIEAFYARLDSFPIKCYEGYISHAFKEGSPIRRDCVFLTMPDQGLYLSGKPLHTVSRIGKKPWIIRSFLRRPGIIYGKGVPELVRHLHKEMNAIHNQRIDAGNMVIAPFFFFRAASGMEPEEISVRPATGIPLDDPKNDVAFPDYNPSRLSVSFQEESIIMDLIRQLTYLSAADFGQETANRPTARGTLALISRSDKPFGLLGARVQRVFTDLITMTRQYYEENLPPGIQERILGENGHPVWGTLSPEMIAGQYDASMELDLTSGDIAFEKQADQLIFQTFVQDPMVNQNPAFAWEIRANYLKSLGKKDVEKIIGPKPDFTNNEGDVEDENHMFAQEQIPKVESTDDHVAHMNGHQQFKREMQGILTPNALRNITTHILEHRFAYTNGLKEQALLFQGGTNGQGGKTGSTGALVTPGVDAIQGPRVGGQTGGTQVTQVPTQQGIG
jgi:hypothetical protein